MTTIVFDEKIFRGLFPAFKNPTVYSADVLSLLWETATAYVSNQTGGCYIGGLTTAQQTLALNQMTAHLTALQTQIDSGQGTGLVQSATVDKVTVSLTPPPETNQWQWWLNQTPYGQQLLALLSVKAVGGNYYGAYPTAFTLRR